MKKNAYVTFDIVSLDGYAFLVSFNELLHPTRKEAFQLLTKSLLYAWLV